MLSIEMVKILIEKDLGNHLHSHYVYNCNRSEQIVAKAKFEVLLEKYNDQDLLELGFDPKSKELIQELISVREVDSINWNKVVIKIIEGIIDCLEREIDKVREIEKPQEIIRIINEQLKKMKIYHPQDKINTQNKKGGAIRVEYLSKKYSPTYDFSKSFELFRDTQFIFTLNFNKGLFIWDYFNIHENFRGKGLGTDIIRFIEKFACSLKFKRYTVEFPNLEFWSKKLDYNIKENYIIGSINDPYYYILEGYKEIKLRDISIL